MALERTVELLKLSCDSLCTTFESQLAGVQLEFSSPWEEAAARSDLQEVQRSDDADILEEAAEELLADSLPRACSAFWRHVESGQGKQWQDAAGSLQSLQNEQCRLLRLIAEADRPVTAHLVAFRVAFTCSWPASVEGLQDYFQQTWKQCLGRAPHQDTEWWCQGFSGQKVLALLDPLRRPQAAARPKVVEECKEDDAMDLDEDCEPEDEELLEEQEGDVLEGFTAVSKAMRELGLGGPWLDLALRFFATQLGELVEERCRSEYDKKGLLDRLTQLLCRSMLPWLRAVFGVPPCAPPALDKSAAADFQAEDAWWCAARGAVLRFYEAFMEVRLGEAFDMVRDFPESSPALLDLRRCLARTGQPASLVKALRDQIARRLLIAGAHTRDVIKVYIKTIKALRLVDPRGLLLEGVLTPIRDYLKKRKDTVRCIITALTEDSDLQQELQLGAEALASASKKARLQAGQPALPVAQEPPDLAGEDCEASSEEDPDSWVPDPMDADDAQPRARKAQDVVSLLVGIYGSKEMFIKEYKEMLADRLLGNPSYSTEREVQNLELLKTRFGDAALTHCEVMLQDIKDSKRINGNVQQLGTANSERVSLGQMNALVLSQHYWPSALSKAEYPRFKLPTPLEAALAEYSNAYTKTKAKRSVQWKKAHGLVEITVQLKDRNLTVTVTPIHYAVLSCFSEAKGSPTRLSLEELVTELELPEPLLRKRLGFWVSKGVLKEVSANLYELQESAPTVESLQSGHLDEEHSPQPNLPTREACSNELRQCESFVQGMLKNYSSLPLERIHNFLQRFMVEPAYTQSESQLKDFLAQKVQEGKLEFDGSSYSLAQAQ